MSLWGLRLQKLLTGCERLNLPSCRKLREIASPGEVVSIDVWLQSLESILTQLMKEARERNTEDFIVEVKEVIAEVKWLLSEVLE